MSDVVLEPPFVSLPETGLSSIDKFVLDTHFYENELAKRNGKLDIVSLQRGCLNDQTLANYEMIVPYHNGNESRDKLEGVVKTAKQFPYPLSKKVQDLKELERDILTVYQVLYVHYVIAKHEGLTNWGRPFPHGNCGPSSRGVVGSLWIQGLLNAAYCVSSTKPDHGYVILPFVLADEFRGVILADPTSDQLREYKGKVHRNLVCIKKGLRWKYKAEFDSGRNLFPDRVLYLGCIANKEAITLGFLTDNYKFYVKDGISFLRQAYANPIELH